MVGLRRSMYTSKLRGAWRSSITVAASRGVAALAPAARMPLATAAIAPGTRIRAVGPGSPSDTSIPVDRNDLGDQLDFDRRIQRQHGHPDRASGVPPRLTEHVEQQFACPVHDLSLAGERRGAGNEPGDLDDPLDIRQPAG